MLLFDMERGLSGFSFNADSFTCLVSTFIYSTPMFSTIRAANAAFILTDINALVSSEW